MTMVAANKDTALHLAVRKSYFESAKLLVEADPSNNLLWMADKNGDTALHMAVKKNNLQIVKLLIEADPSNNLLRMVDKDGDTALHIAFQQALTGDETKVEIRRLLIEKQQRTALHSAVIEGDFESAKLLIEADPSKNLLGMVDENGDTALHMAVKNNNLPIVKLLVEGDPSFEYYTNVMGHTPVFIAFQQALTGDETKVEIRRLLIEKQPSQCKVPIGIGTKNWTLLHRAAYEGDQSTIEDIIKFCPECLEFVDIDYQNFLHIAVKFKHTDVVANILKLSTITDEILNGQDKYGNTPFHIASMGQNERMTTCFLYNSRVCKTIINRQGLRAIDMILFDYDKRKAGVRGLVNRLGEKDIKDQTDFDLLVGALIATVSFTAGITVPGGYTSDGPNKGTAVLAKKLSFKVFLITNTIALLLSLYAVFCHFCVKHLDKEEDISYQLNVATFCSFGSIFAMAVAFITGSYVVLAVTEEFSIIVCVLCCCFFLFAFRALWKILRQKKPSLFNKCLEVRGICGCFSISSITSLFYAARD